MKRITMGLLLWGMALAAGAEAGFVDFDRGWIFPDRLAGMAFQKAEKYADADMGYSVFYRKRRSTFSAEVSVCTLGFDPVPDGCRSKTAKKIIEGVGTELEWQKKSGKISRLQKRGAAIVPSEGPLRFASVVYEYSDGGIPMILATYITGTNGVFIKVRMSCKKREASAAKQMETQMLTQLGKMATTKPDEKTLLLAACSAFLNDPASSGGRLAARYLMAKAQQMDNLNVYTNLFVWPQGYYSKPRNADLLIAGYFAGMLQVVVPKNLDEGGEYEAFLAMLKTYQKLRETDQIRRIDELDDWVKAPDKKALYQKLLTVE